MVGGGVGAGTVRLTCQGVEVLDLSSCRISRVLVETREKEKRAF